MFFDGVKVEKMKTTRSKYFYAYSITQYKLMIKHFQVSWWETADSLKLCVYQICDQS